MRGGREIALSPTANNALEQRGLLEPLRRVDGEGDSTVLLGARVAAALARRDLPLELLPVPHGPELPRGEVEPSDHDVANRLGAPPGQPKVVLHRTRWIGKSFDRDQRVGIHAPNHFSHVAQYLHVALAHDSGI